MPRLSPARNSQESRATLLLFACLWATALPLCAQEVTLGLYGGALLSTKHLLEIQQPGIYQYQQTLTAPAIAARLAVQIAGPFSLEALGGLSSANHKTYVDFFADPNFESDGNIQFAAVRILTTPFPHSRTRPTLSLGLGLLRRHFEFVGGPGESTRTATGISGALGVTHSLGTLLVIRAAAEAFSYSPNNIPFTPGPGVTATVNEPKQLDLALLVGLDLRLHR